MRFLKGFVGGLLGAIPGVALIPVLEFFALVVILLGIIAGAMIGAAPQGRRKVTAVRTLLGVIAGVVLALAPGGFGFLLAPLVVVYAGWSGMHEAGGGPGHPAQL
jgi:uncharacterized membrane protein HdeD (DUF308 family)